MRVFVFVFLDCLPADREEKKKKSACAFERAEITLREDIFPYSGEMRRVQKKSRHRTTLPHSVVQYHRRGALPHSVVQYHRRGAPYRSCSGWEREFQARNRHREKICIKDVRR